MSRRIVTAAVTVMTVAAAFATTLAAPVAHAATSDPVIAAAGDIACDPADPNYNGGAGVSTACQQFATSNLLVNHGYAAVLPLGDNQYSTGSSAQYNASYEPSWGRVKGISHPVPGNHDYQTAAAAGYFGYFGAAAGDSSAGYYSYDVGGWHLIALNSNCTSVSGGCAAGSPQETWLRQDLAAHTNTCVRAYWHHPTFSSGEDGNNPITAAFWQDLYNSGADIVLAGHAHEYERFAPQTAQGVVDNTYGLTEFVDGTGGDSFEPAGPQAANSVVLKDGVFGVLQLTLHASSADFSFVGASGSSFTDSGTVNCHGAPPANSLSAPTGVDGTAGDGRAYVSWTPPSSGSAASYTVTASPGGASVTVTGTSPSAVVGGLSNGTPYTFTVTAANSAGVSPTSAPSPSITPRAAPTGADYASSVLQDEPAAYWRLDEASTASPAADASGNGRGGSYSGGVTVGQAGATSSGTSASFDGSTGQVAAADAAPLRLNGPFTIEFWAKMTSFANSWPGILRKGSAATADGYVVWYTSNGTLHFKRDNLDVATPTGSLTTSFRHFAVVNDGTTTTWYVNGKAVASGPMSLPTDNGKSSLVLGQGDQAGRETLDEVAVYNNALPASRVAAHFAAATGTTSASAPGAPTNVSATAGNASATVTWSAPASDGGSIVTSYTVRASNGATVSVGGSTMTATFTGLTNGTSYTFTVTAANSVGSGSASTPSNAVTPMTVPGAPTNVSATAGNASATVTWSAPASDGGAAISAYVIRGSDGSQTTVSGSSRSATVGSLTNGVSYTFTVAAINAVGTGPDSVATGSVTPAPAPTSSASYATTVLADNPIGYWRLGESSGTTAADGSGHGLNGSYVGGVTLGQPGALMHDTDTAVAFNGSSGACTVSDNSALRLNGTFTIEFWAKEKAFANSWPGLVVKGASGTANGFLIWYSSNGTLHFKRNNVDVATPAGAIVTTAWHAYDVTYDGSTLRWYVDGTQVASRAVAFPANAGTDPLQFGRGDQFGNEAMDEVAVYATTLSPSRITAHYSAATT